MKDNLYPKNSTSEGGELRGAIPIAEEYHEIDATLSTDGTKTVTVASSFGTGLGEVIGAYTLQSAGEKEVFGVTAAASATAGSVDIKIQSSDTASTTALTDFPVMLIGKIIPAS